MKKITFLIFVFLFACKDSIPEIDNKEPEPIYDILVTVFYKNLNTPEVIYPDVGARVFVYYDIVSMDLSDCTYLGNGKFEKKDLVIIPATETKIDRTGEVIIIPEYTDRKVTIVVESDKGGITHNSYSSIFENIIFKVEFLL